ncbi:Palmitoyltransferase PFA5 [Scheffersomyces coipomensis]|uniref:Palmitoyltransferase PFA5 n=1 Tax=Scheffersomyces coipomensis TaxID=1788519 RepID=UPI00315DF264
MIFDIPFANNRILQLIVPVLVVIGLGYYDFVMGFCLGHQVIYKYHSHGVAISLWILLAFLQLSVFIYWILIFIIGPGKAPKFPPFNLRGDDTDELTQVPNAFECDRFGYPFYSSHTDSLVLPRGFYSKHTGYNVLKYDHYCLWIGTVLGECNYLFFMKFMTFFLLHFIIPIIYLMRYTRSQVSREGEINHNFIPAYVLSGFWIIIIGALFAVHLKYVCVNMTTLDEITMKQKQVYQRWELSNEKEKKTFRRKPRKEDGKRYINIKKDNLRVVVQYDVMDEVYNMGFKKNWINLIFNGNRNHGKPSEFYTTKRLITSFVIFLVPFIDIPYGFKYRSHPMEREGSDPESLLIEFEKNSSAMNPEFVQSLYQKIENKECYLASYLPRSVIDEHTYQDQEQNHNDDTGIPDTTNEKSPESSTASK